jgi:hypothetical protein
MSVKGVITCTCALGDAEFAQKVRSRWAIVLFIGFASNDQLRPCEPMIVG